MTTLSEKFTLLENFGHSLRAPSYLFQPENAEEMQSAFKLAKETGLTITPVRLAGYREAIHRDADQRVERHFVILPFAAHWMAGEPVLNEELSEARWVTPADIAGLATTPGLADVVAAAQALLSGQG
jgi:ADP-ribose pyrophosphatase YjhB (NUDIX family)